MNMKGMVNINNIHASSRNGKLKNITKAKLSAKKSTFFSPNFFISGFIIIPPNRIILTPAKAEKAPINPIPSPYRKFKTNAKVEKIMLKAIANVNISPNLRRTRPVM